LRIVRSEQIDRESPFPGTNRRVLFVDENVMVSLFEASPDTRIPSHSHANVQMGYVLQGKAEYVTPGSSQTLEPGAFYYFSSNEAHEIRNVGNENAVSLDIFIPPLEQVLRAWRAKKDQS
jgi:quercetin dioxygenase-like cupin family protein